jgi:transcription elongation factor Elf1
MAISRKDPSARTYVNCPTCAREILVVTTLRLPGEFSVLCPNCGERQVYQSVDAHGTKQDPGGIKTSRRIQFGKKKAMHPNPG